MSIIVTIVILCVLIVVHEFGHFIVAKINGVYVEEFSLGMGPKLLQWGKKETRYSVRLLPIGGYVKMCGEDEDSENPRAFCNKSVLQRMAIIFCGPFMNFLIAIVFFMVAYMYFGAPSPSTTLGEIVKDSPAAVAGLETGDKVYAIDGVEVNSWNEMVEQIRSKPNQEIVFEYEHDGELEQTTIIPILDETGSYGIIGVTQSIEKANVIASIKTGFMQTYQFTKLMIVSLVDMVTGDAPVEVGGPVMIEQTVDAYMQEGFMYLFLLAGILSINLGIINLLPIPALDGSRLVFLLIEGIRRKPVPSDKEAMVHFIGLIAMFGLMIFITYQDILRITTG